MSKRTSYALIVSTLALLAIPVMAQQPPQDAPPPPSSDDSMQPMMQGGPAMMGPGMHSGMHQGMGYRSMMRQGMSSGAALEGRLASLKYELKITPKQEATWDAFAKTIRENMKEKEEAMKTMMPQGNPRAMQSGPPTATGRTLPEEIALHEKMMKESTERMQKFKKAVDPLYKSLSDDQKKTADQQMMTLGMFF